LTLVCLALALAAGCASVPNGGPVLSGRPVQPSESFEDTYVRVIPSGPRKGWSPEQIVRGFLAASASFEHDHAVAREYLAKKVRDQWEPQQGVTIYEQGNEFRLFSDLTSPAEDIATIEAPQLATIDETGQYTPADPGSTVRPVFRLNKIGGDWRIVSFPQGLLLTGRDVARAYRTLDLYFFDPEMQVLVPNPVYVPVQVTGDLRATLVRSLVRGPTDWLAPAVDTAFPTGTRVLDVERTLAGTLTVDLGGTAAETDPSAWKYMAAQLVWTLQQLPDVERLRLQIKGEPVDLSGFPVDVQRPGSWSRFYPSQEESGAQAYVVRKSRIWTLSPSGDVREVPGPAGSGSVPLSQPAVSLDGQWVAGEAPTGDLVVGPLREDGTFNSALAGSDFLAPSWDRAGNLWVAQSRGDASVVWMLDPGRNPVRVSMPALAGREIRALRVAPDGVRVALVVGDGGSSRLMLARIERDGERARIAGPVALRTGLERVSSVAWRDLDRLAVLGRDVQGVTIPYLVPVDGTRVSPTAAVGDMSSIAAASDQPMLAGVEKGQIWFSRDDLTWQYLTTGRYPFYPG
jgi:hypothetical protein